MGKKRSLNTVLWFLAVSVMVVVLLAGGFKYAQWRLRPLDDVIGSVRLPQSINSRSSSNPTSPRSSSSPISSAKSPQSANLRSSSNPTLFSSPIPQRTLFDFRRERIDLEIKIMVGVVQLLGAVFLAITAYVSWQNLQETRNNIALAEKTLKTTEGKNITERYTRAIEQLGSEEITIRFGSIYALERIAKDSPEEYHWTIIEVLASFIQETSRLPKPAKDVQAALTVIGRRNAKNDQIDPNQIIDLTQALLAQADLSGSTTDFSNANLSSAKLMKANLSEANLCGAKLIMADLTNANFSYANLMSADLTKANLTKADLTKANLTKADLREVDLTKVNLCEANLTGADLLDADLSMANLFLTNINHETQLHFKWRLVCKLMNGGRVEDLSNADLTNANLIGVVLEKINLSGANLQGSDLSGSNLKNATLIGTNLRGTKLIGADLRGANLKDADLADANLEGALFCDTTMPNGEKNNTQCPKYY